MSELLDGMLPVAEAAAVREHLAGCVPCRRERDTLASTWDLLGEWEPKKPARDFTRSVMARIAAEERQKVVPLRPAVVPMSRQVAPLWRRPALVSRMVAAVAVVILSAVMFLPTQRQSDRQAEAVVNEVIASFELESQVALIDDVPTYIVSESEEREKDALHDLLDPGADTPAEEVLEELLVDPKDRNG